MNSQPFVCAAEGDLRLTNDGEIDNWVTGNLQVFFEGAWGQVCSGNFGPPDADVACRQLGFGAGTIAPRQLSDAELDALEKVSVFLEVAFTGLACNGTEDRLVDCDANFSGPEIDLDPDYGLSVFTFDLDRGCRNVKGDAFNLACVKEELTGSDAGA